MTINHEIERQVSPKEDPFFSAMRFIKELAGFVERGQVLDRKTYEERYHEHMAKYGIFFGPEYPVILAGENGYNRLVGKIADPVIDILEGEKDKATNDKNRNDFLLIIDAIKLEKEKASRELI